MYIAGGETVVQKVPEGINPSGESVCLPEAGVYLH